MSYDIDHCEYLEGSLSIDADTARRLVQEIGDDLPEGNFLTEKALTHTKGAADILIVWEGGDHISGVRVRDGIVVEMGVEIKLVPKKK